MDKAGKITADIVLALCASLTLGFLIYREYKTSMIAVVQGGEWIAPRSVVTELEAMDSKRRRAIDPDRMTGVHANETCSLYLVNIRNKGKHKTVNTQMTMPTALHWEVSWLSEGGEKQTKQYSQAQLIILPGIQSDRDVDVKVWAACDPSRSHTRKMKITQDDGYSARLHIRLPVWPWAQCLSQHIRKVLWIGIILAIVLVTWWRKGHSLESV